MYPTFSYHLAQANIGDLRRRPAASLDPSGPPGAVGFAGGA